MCFTINIMAKRTIRPRKKAGRKSEFPTEKMQRKLVTVDALTVDLAKVLGEGNLSKGIRDAVLVAYDRYQRTPD